MMVNMSKKPKKQTRPETIKYVVELFIEEKNVWVQQMSGRSKYAQLAWASKRAFKLGMKSGQQYRVADLTGNTVYMAERQLQLFAA